MNPMEEQIKKMSTTSENMTYLVDNRKNICQHNKLHPLIAKISKWISETMYKDIEKLFSTTHRNTSIQRVEMIYQIINILILRLNMIRFVAHIVLNHCV